MTNSSHLISISPADLNHVTGAAGRGWSENPYNPNRTQGADLVGGGKPGINGRSGMLNGDVNQVIVSPFGTHTTIINNYAAPKPQPPISVLPGHYKPF